MTMVAGDTILRVEHVDFAYGRLQVLFDVSLEVHAGEALALLGTNGAGKSTLLKVVAGLERPAAGRVEFGGADATDVGAEALVEQGVVLGCGGQAIFPDRTVAENLDMQGFLLRRDRRRLQERQDAVLDVFPSLRARLDNRAGTMSGGEQQQLALAKALLLDPSLLCIDELSLGLAPVVIAELLEVVERIRSTGVSIVLVEQSLNVAAEVCERAVFLEKGAVRFEGRTADLLERDDIARAVFLGESGPADKAPRRRATRNGRRS